MIKVAIAGISGRMGKAIFDEALKTDGMKVILGCLRRKELPYLVPNDFDLKLIQDFSSCDEKVDVVIDFSLAGLFDDVAAYCQKFKIPLVSGTTGLSEKQNEMMSALSKEVAVLYDTNMSVGVTLLKSFVEKASSLLGVDYDVEIAETHHRFKKDAPSGTAISLGEAVSIGRGHNSDQMKTAPYESGKTREVGTIGFSVQRGGNVVGEHSVRFLGEYEEVAFTHRAFDRSIYAKGALSAAKWISEQKPGLYGMKDCLGL